MRYAGETACATNGKSFACIGGTGFSLSTPACGRIFSHLLSEGLPPNSTVLGGRRTSSSCSPLFERLQHPRRSHRQLPHPCSRGIVNCVGDHRAHGNDRRLAAAPPPPPPGVGGG